MKKDPDFLIKWSERLLSTRRLYEWAWQDIVDYILVNKVGVYDVSPGRKKTGKLYDGTATRAINRLAATMHGSLTSNHITWFKLKMRDNRMNRIKRVRIWLEGTGEDMIQEFGNSNFASEIHELYKDMIGFGTGALFSEEAMMKFPGRFPGINFTAVPVGTYAIDLGPDGRANTFFRWMKLNAFSIQKLFGEYKNIPDEIVKAAEERKDTQYEIIHAIFPREDGESKRDTPAEKLPFASMYVCKKHKAILKESGFHEFPTNVPRWDQLSGETYGRGPSHEVLPDIKTANKAVELSLKAFAKAIDPPLKAKHDGIVGGEVRLTSGGITYVTEMDALMPMELGSKWDVIKFKVEDIRQSIKEAYLADHIQLKDSPAMTAEEVRTRQEQMIRLLGPTLGRLESELLNPLIQRVFNMMFRAGVIEQPPAEVMDAVARGGGEIDVEYTGPLARGQRINEVYAIERLYSLAEAPAATNPGILDKIDADAALEVAAEILGAPERVIRDQKTVEQIRSDRADAQAQADQSNQDRIDAATAKDLKSAQPDPGDGESEAAQVLRVIQGGRT